MGYHASLARTFRTYLSAEYNLETSRHEGLDIIENAVDNLDSRNDKHKIMDMHNQVFCPPMRFEYLPHMGDEVRALGFFVFSVLVHRFLPQCPSQVCQVSAQQPVQTELLMRYHQLQSRLATLKIENEEVRMERPAPQRRETQTALSHFPQSQEDGRITICSQCNYPKSDLSLQEPGIYLHCHNANISCSRKKFV